MYKYCYSNFSAIYAMGLWRDSRIISPLLKGLTCDTRADILLVYIPDRLVRVRVLACVVFFGKTLYSHGASLHSGV